MSVFLSTFVLTERRFTKQKELRDDAFRDLFDLFLCLGFFWKRLSIKGLRVAKVVIA